MNTREVRGPAEAYKYAETRKKKKKNKRKMSRNSATGTVAFSRGGRPRGPSHNPRVGPHQRAGESPTRARIEETKRRRDDDVITDGAEETRGAM